MQQFLALTAFTFLLGFAAQAVSQDELPQAGGPGAPAGQSGRPAAGQGAAANPNDAAYRQQVSYSLGRNFAENLRDNQVDGLDLNALVAGISDIFTGAKPKWTEEECQPAMVRFSQEMRQKAMSRMNQQSTKNKQEADAFLAQNGKREGVQTTPSGLQYRVVKSGNGPSPTLNDMVRCNYRGTLINGTEFDSSQAQGGAQTFPVRGVIPGWTEALQKMQVGDKWQLFVPANLAYGTDPPGPPIEANSMLVFDIELLEILPQ